MSRQTKFKIGDKVRRTSPLVNGSHRRGTIDTIVEVTVAGTFDSYDIYRNSEGFYSENNDHGCMWCDADNYELVERAGEQRKDALGAMKMLEIIIIDLTNDLIKNKNPSFSEQTVEMMVDSFKQVRAALQSATISETQLEYEIEKTAMSETRAAFPDFIYVGRVRGDRLICFEADESDETKYIRADIQSRQPKLERVDLDQFLLKSVNHYCDGNNRAISLIKAKYGEIYVEVKG